MLLIEPRGARIVVMRDTREDLALLARMEEVTGWGAGELSILGARARQFDLAGATVRTRTFRDVLGPRRVEEIEYEAYGLADALVAAAVRVPSLHDLVLSCYHEIASNWFQLSLVYHAAVAAGPRTVAVVEADLYEAFRRVLGRLRKSQIDVLTLGWKHRQLPITSPERRHYLLSGFSQTHPVLWRRLTLIGSLWRNDDRARRFYRRRIRRLRHQSVRLGVDLVRLFRALRGADRLGGETTLPRQIADRFERSRKQRAQPATRGGGLEHARRLGERVLRRDNYQRRRDVTPVTGGIGRRAVRQVWRRFREAALSQWERLGAHVSPEPSAITPGVRKDVVLLTVSDSGSRVNLDPAIAIAAELSRRGMDSLLVTDSAWINQDVGLAGGNVVNVRDGAGPVGSERLPGRLFPTGAKRVPLRAAQGELLAMNWPYYLRRRRQYQRAYDRIAASRRVRAVFSINETLPLAVDLGRRAMAERIPWIGHFPILVGARPDGYFFPAPVHLAYGGQIRDHMISAGKNATDIHILGTHTYDKHLGRDRAADRIIVERDFPRARGKKLVTIGTEAFPDPYTELGPILSTVPFIDGVHAVLKLHPDDQIEDFEALAEQLGVRDRIDIVKRYPLGQLLAASDLLMVVVSNIAIEAAVSGTPTLICDFSGKARSVNFVEQGLCLGVTDPAEVGASVRDILFDPARAREAAARIAKGVSRFNGPSDGASSSRIAAFILDRMGLPADLPTSTESHAESRTSDAASTESRSHAA